MTVNEQCIRCGKLISSKKIVYLELNMDTGIYTDPRVSGYLSENISQGMHPFGKNCAISVLKNKGELDKYALDW
jgi:hypothetical protein